jgi:hypothetical protein
MALLCHYLVEEHDHNLGFVYFKNFSPQRIPWLWIQYVASPNGLKQGDALSSLLFNFALEYAIKSVQVS